MDSEGISRFGGRCRWSGCRGAFPSFPTRARTCAARPDRDFYSSPRWQRCAARRRAATLRCSPRPRRRCGERFWCWRMECRATTRSAASFACSIRRPSKRPSVGSCAPLRRACKASSRSTARKLRPPYDNGKSHMPPVMVTVWVANAPATNQNRGLRSARLPGA